MRVMPCLLLLVFATAAYAQAPPADSLTYDVVVQKDWEERNRLFNLATPEQKAAIAREQSIRWLTHNRASLSAEQIAFLEEVIAYIQPSRYEGESTEEQEAEVTALGVRALALFTPDQAFHAFAHEASPYIPKP